MLVGFLKIYFITVEDLKIEYKKHTIFINYIVKVLKCSTLEAMHL